MNTDDQMAAREVEGETQIEINVLKGLILFCIAMILFILIAEPFLSALERDDYPKQQTITNGILV